MVRGTHRGGVARVQGAPGNSSWASGRVAGGTGRPAPRAGTAAWVAHLLGGGAVPVLPRFSQRQAQPGPLPGAARGREQPTATVWGKSL